MTADDNLRWAADKVRWAVLNAPRMTLSFDRATQLADEIAAGPLSPACQTCGQPIIRLRRGRRPLYCNRTCKERNAVSRERQARYMREYRARIRSGGAA